jgi:hypothetical protein
MPSKKLVTDTEGRADFVCSARSWQHWSELVLPRPLAPRRVCTPPLVPWDGGGGEHTRFREREWEGPNSDEGTDNVVL